MKCEGCSSDFTPKRKDQRYISRKAQVFEEYGSRCTCCGLDDVRFLTIDHVNNDGFKDKFSGTWLIDQVIREAFPERFQLLCWNCNCAKHHNGGICPHQTAERIENAA
jgi:hypothetical protein